jgi:GTP-binding protein
MVDIASDDPERDYAVIREELRLHDPALLNKPTLVVANKIDLPAASGRLADFVGARKREGLETVAVSALSGENVDAVVAALGRLLPDADALASPPEPAGVVVHRFDSARDAFVVEREGDAFRIRGRRIERLAAQTDFDNDESAERFQRDLSRLGVERELRRAGVSPGDTVRIGAHEMEWDADAWR